MTEKCCSEHNCRRKSPILVRRGAFSDQWTAITAYTTGPGNLITATTKHALDPVSQAEIELGGSVLRELFEQVKAQYELEDTEDGDRAYRDVLDRIHALTEAKREQLLGPREAAS